MALRSISLCSGIGGIDIALHDVARTICYVERDTFAVDLLRRAMLRGELHDAPVWDDLLSFDARAWCDSVDLVVAGFPCQPFSTASRGRKVALDLWPECLRVIDESGASLAFAENVAADPIRRAAHDLLARGFRVAMAPLAASQLGAPHERPRWWLLADANRDGELLRSVHAEMARLSPADVAQQWARLPGDVLGVDDGIPRRMDRLRTLGNAVVPPQARFAFRLLAERLVGERAILQES